MRTIAIALACLCSFAGAAQDLLVTKAGDSINCKVVSRDDEYFYFTFVHHNVSQLTLIDASLLTAYKRDFYQAGPGVNKGAPSVPAAKEKDIRAYASLGVSRQLGEVDGSLPAPIRSIVNQTLFGLNLNAGLDLFLSQKYGLGFCYSYFASYGKETATLFNGRIYYLVDISSRLGISDYSVSFLSRSRSKNGKHQIASSSGVAFVSYYNDLSLPDRVEVSGITLALRLGLWGDIHLTEKLSLRMGIKCLIGSVSEIDIADASGSRHVSLGSSPESITRIDGFFGFNIKLGKH